ncbi:helix-turn-helix transcriptional regulator [Brevibacterium sp. 50QC2O2]|uniref:heat shock protein transcriptional repressor HspR n=1 Tax=Brevibacterium TaxID=1696 RepID=UPI00211BB2F3|nr:MULTISPECIES: helix-turn-helix transcriptional regulator [unclassified Brevibacterium]MCQ9369121.1 helix-turn-helix transcriptional regulator [Brevibacterium sp. 91QC2O2]MCQ9386478.1 helix-turn-helix transcriptional regulator [Brevibacterium sp. 68QC2CO]MCQ9387058.1 helix-turn-helix transcriptional regulator [Brevibacterium sp. 50QC2O2]
MEIDPHAAVYVISVAAELAGMHPQTLRQYDRMGLVTPKRTPGRGRRYSASDIEKLRLVQSLSQDEGVSLAGIKRILQLREEVADAHSQLQSLGVQLDAALSRLAQANRIFAAGMGGDVTVADPYQRSRARRMSHAIAELPAASVTGTVVGVRTAGPRSKQGPRRG